MTRTLLFAALLTALASCSDAPVVASPEVVVTDSAGVPVRTFPQVPADLSAWAVDETPVLQVGETSGASPEVFGRVTSVQITPDDAIVVADELAGEIRTFSLDGAHLGSVGRTGEGPGEFNTSAYVVRVAGDSIFAWDGRSQRLSTFVDGAFADSWSTPDGVVVSNVLMDGPNLYGQTSARLGGDGGLPESGMHRPNAVYGRLTEDGSHTELVDVAGHERYLDIQTTGGQVTGVAVFQTPFARGAFFSTVALEAGDRVLGGSNDRFVVHEWDRDGSLVAVHRYPGLDDPITDDDVERARERVRERFEEPTARMRVELETLASTVPEYRPAFDRIWPDDAGHLWMRHAVDDGVEEWVILTLDGLAPTARLTLPRGFALMDVRRGLLAGRWQDDFDIAHVRVYRLRAD